MHEREGMKTDSVPRVANFPSIVVAVRKRPKMAQKESEEKDVICCETATTVVVCEPKARLDLTPFVERTEFNFDYVFDESATNADVYKVCCRPLLEVVRRGGSAVVFAFGQTGSGKTYTMLGRSGSTQGLYSHTVTELLAMDATCTLSVSFYEVYGSKLFDLLNGRARVRMLQDERRIHIAGLSERAVSSSEELHRLMLGGQLLRSVGMTLANSQSSRSHAVLDIKVCFSSAGTTPGRFTFVDLAGSERAAEALGADVKVRREGAEINKSLLALKECIRALSSRMRHIPFRASKLTQILRECFVGQCKTCVIANVSPCLRHCEDSLNTLRYANHMRELKKAITESVFDGARTFPNHDRSDSNLQAPMAHPKKTLQTPLEQRHFTSERMTRRIVSNSPNPSPQGHLPKRTDKITTSLTPTSSTTRGESTPSLPLSDTSPLVSLEGMDEGGNFCPYTRYGCVKNLSGMDLRTHLRQEITQHLRLVLDYADKVEAENAALRRLIFTKGRNDKKNVKINNSCDNNFKRRNKSGLLRTLLS